MPRRSSSTDPRAVRVRGIIERTALELVTERPVDTISVTELIKTAGVSRQAFYEHFKDRDTAIIAALRGDLLQALDTRTEEIDGVPIVLSSITRLVAERSAHHEHLRGSTLFGAVIDLWREQLAPACGELATRLIQERRDELTAEDHRALSAFILGGVTELVRSWARETAQIPPDRQAELAWQQVRRFVGLQAGPVRTGTSTG
ncbi:TetR family transcriptional regulator [Actinocorallia herbida]|uniref:TetR family transcriptional regulator n=1 Tax=Actinocorallia herbida TaxID=58109 RepID=A0A3N1D2X8_9ACTN|nr:TetR/AcrR family transcriptional regulator [Actinocorallia herbida]ROO87879.1 TetR family transcriptional regulator [Actinocorallia herbida]